MTTHSRHEKDEEISGEWLVTEANIFGYLMNNAPPRPGAYIRCLWYDAHDWKVLAIWLATVAAVPLGIVFMDWVWVWFFLLAVAYALSVWVWAFWQLAPALRNRALLAGQIQALGPHPLGRKWSIATATIADGTQVSVYLRTSPAQEIIKKDGAAQVLLLNTLNSYSPVIAVRAMPKRDATA